MTQRKNEDYWEGMRAQAVRQAEKDVRKAMDRHYMNSGELATSVAQHLVRENGRKTEILKRSPHLARGLDAEELGQMSALELANRELAELGITPDERSLPEQLLSAHHAGRAFARGGNRVANASAQDSRGGDSIVAKHFGLGPQDGARSFVDKHYFPEDDK